MTTGHNIAYVCVHVDRLIFNTILVIIDMINNRGRHSISMFDVLSTLHIISNCIL